ncbi:four-helix bundle copper-binding protein [Thalassoglobus sp.]|uniref:four-helix bundle copper-binding protein n=1 Tax=Thalassoglobus sp. TaxID=2795869 RepID=UPI003AA8D3DE
MLDEQSDNDCPRCCRECIDLCLLCAQAIARNSRFSEEICKLCADACEWCAEQCGAHDHDHCQKCAEACRACVKSCRSMAQAS